MAEIDLIFCSRIRPPDCCLARHAGWMTGCRSDDIPTCPYCRVEFVDVDFKDYDWERYKDFIQQHKPKYAIVPDILCAGDVDITLQRAEILQKYSTYPIIVPKIDCVREIPDHYILGYAIPTEYGNTPISFGKFKERRLHLLGGSPRMQYRYWTAAREEIRSLDGNYIVKVADYGEIWDERLRRISLNKFHIKGCSKGGRYVALASSLMNLSYFWANIEQLEVHFKQFGLWKEDEI